MPMLPLSRLRGKVRTATSASARLLVEIQLRPSAIKGAFILICTNSEAFVRCPVCRYGIAPLPFLLRGDLLLGKGTKLCQCALSMEGNWNGTHRSTSQGGQWFQALGLQL